MMGWPKDYHRVQAAGLISKLTDPEDPLMIWDADFLTEKEIEAFECLEDQIISITPFAKTSGGDYWAYLTDNLPQSDIVLCYIDSYEAEYVAKDFSQFIFRQTVAFAGNEGLSYGENKWDIESAKRMVCSIFSEFSEIIPERMLDALRQIASMSDLNTINEWTTLIPEVSSRQLIDEFVISDLEETLFYWRD